MDILGVKCAMVMTVLLSQSVVPEAGGTFTSMLDVRYWQCVMKRQSVCPDSDIKYFLFTPDHRLRRRIDLRVPDSLARAGWDPGRKNIIIIHGFNGTESKTPMSFIRDVNLNGDLAVCEITEVQVHRDAVENSLTLFEKRDF